MALDQITRLRQLIGEPIPPGPGRGEADTRFTDLQVQDFLDQSPTGSLTQAAYIGWLAKAAIFADLVSTTEGNASRLSSDLYEHARSMAKYYEGLLPLAVQGRTRVGKITRPGTGAI